MSRQKAECAPLAELANDLELIGSGRITRAMKLRIGKAQKIVRELSLIDDNMLNASCTVAMLMRCRAIAREG